MGTGKTESVWPMRPCITGLGARESPGSVILPVDATVLRHRVIGLVTGRAFDLLSPRAILSVVHR